MADSLAEPLLPPEDPLPAWEAAGLTDSKSQSLWGALNRWSNHTQARLLQAPPGWLSWLALAFFHFLEAGITYIMYLFDDYDQSFLIRSRIKHVGPNFVLYGMLMVGQHSKAAEIATRPQFRQPYIAWGKYVAKRCPVNTLLFLPDASEGGDGTREQLKAVFMRLFNSEKALASVKDEVSQRRLAEFAQKVVDNQKRLRSFLRSSRALSPIYEVIRYALFDIHPEERTPVTKAFDGLFVPYNITRVWPIGLLFPEAPSRKEREWRDRMGDAEPVKAFDLASAGQQPSPLTMGALLDGLMPAIFIGAMPGVTNFLEYALPSIKSSVEVPSDTPERALAFMHECLRAHPPVATVPGGTMREFHVFMGGQKHTFPPKTVMAYSIYTSCQDPTVFPDPLRFDYARPNLSSKILNFANLGGQSFGRQCPGQLLSEAIGVQVVLELGRLGWRGPAK